MADGLQAPNIQVTLKQADEWFDAGGMIGTLHGHPFGPTAGVISDRHHPIPQSYPFDFAG
jgi:hypothetical protein